MRLEAWVVTLSAPDKIALFLATFRGREDFHAVRWESRKVAGYRPVPGPLDEAAAERHLRGQQVLGLYPLLPDGTTWFLAADFDGSGADRDARRFWRAARGHGIPCYLERSRSGQGLHAWVFFQNTVPAARARLLGRLLLGAPPASFDRFFPSQDRARDGGVGNLIALPLQGEARTRGHTLFLDPEGLEPLPDQWEQLRSLERLSDAALDQVLTLERLPDYAPLPAPGRAAPASIVLGEHLEIADCPREVEDFLRDLAVFPNPEWHRRQQAGRFLDRTPRMIYCCRWSDGTFLCPRGPWERLRDFLGRRQVSLDVVDHRTHPPGRPTRVKTPLRPYQAAAVLALLRRDHSVLQAPTGSGKTLTALATVAERGTPALILVHQGHLLEQWVEAIQVEFGLERREVGIVNATTRRFGEWVTVAMMQTLVRDGPQRSGRSASARWWSMNATTCRPGPLPPWSAVCGPATCWA